MKAKTFENLIRKVVREEIDYALRREIKSLKEDLRDEIKPVIKENSKPLTNSTLIPKSSLKDQIMGSTPLKKQKTRSLPKQKFTSDGVLNDLLNETAQGDTNLESGNISPVSLAEPFASGESTPTDTTGLPPAVANAMTRDYSELMEAMDKRKKNN